MTVTQSTGMALCQQYTGNVINVRSRMARHDRSVSLSQSHHYKEIRTNHAELLELNMPSARAWMTVCYLLSLRTGGHESAMFWPYPTLTASMCACTYVSLRALTFVDGNFHDCQVNHENN